MAVQYEAGTSPYRQGTFIVQFPKLLTTYFHAAGLRHLSIWLYSAGTALPLTLRTKPFLQKALVLF